ncbi:hypothetical protein AB837_00478 [bacterium AB1]|nr:hypothetical protein AB837_00478 [bacterium AB1]
MVLVQQIQEILDLFSIELLSVSDKEKESFETKITELDDILMSTAAVVDPENYIEDLDTTKSSILSDIKEKSEYFLSIINFGSLTSMLFNKDDIILKNQVFFNYNLLVINSIISYTEMHKLRLQLYVDDTSLVTRLQQRLKKEKEINQNLSTKESKPQQEQKQERDKHKSDFLISRLNEKIIYLEKKIEEKEKLLNNYLKQEKLNNKKAKDLKSKFKKYKISEKLKQDKIIDKLKKENFDLKKQLLQQSKVIENKHMQILENQTNTKQKTSEEKYELFPQPWITQMTRQEVHDWVVLARQNVISNNKSSSLLTDHKT